MKTTLKTLCELPGVSGREEAVRKYIVDTLAAIGTEKQIIVDPMGNVICKLKGEKPANKTLLLCAHMDEVGLIITSITNDGFLKFENIGGVNEAVLCGKRVKIGEITGVIGCKAVHLCTKEEKEKIPKKKDLVIDIGVSGEKAKKLVKPGDIATFDTPFVDLQTLVMGKAIDDRIGCVLLLELAKKKPLYDITLAFTVQEEVGTRGAGPVAFAVAPDIAITVETTTAADIADVPDENRVCTVGRGPVLSFMDLRTLYDADLYAQIRSIADENNIPNQTKSVVSGGNDAGTVQRTANGTRIAAISVPCRYLHSASCVSSMTDAENTKKLLELLVEVLPQ